MDASRRAVETALVGTTEWNKVLRCHPRGHLDIADIGMLDRHKSAAAFPACSGQAAGAVLDIIGGATTFGLQQQSIITVAGYEVDYPSHCVRAIDRGGAVGQHFDALNSDGGNGRRVGLRMAGAAQGES